MKEEITMKDVVSLLNIPCDMSKGQTYIACPLCAKNERQKKLNINFRKNVFRCNKCDVSGGSVAFWGLYRNISDPKEAAKDYFKTAKKGQKENPSVAVKKQPEYEYPEEKIVPIQERNKAYQALIDELVLSDAHKKALLARGLSERTIEKNEYRSVPIYDLKKIAQKLQKNHGVILDGIPGFFNESGWELRKISSGILIPQRDGLGRIQGFQIRLDKVTEDGPRYISLSSSGMKNGAPAHTYCHFAKGSMGTKEIILTEGALKADVISEIMDYSVLAVPGVNSRKYLPEAIRALKRFGLSEVYIAFDMDRNVNPHVQKALEDLKKELDDLDVVYDTLVWDEGYKGLDDYLCAKYRHIIEAKNSAIANLAG